MSANLPTRSPYLIPVMLLFFIGVLIFLGVLVNYVFNQTNIPTTTSIAQVFTYTAPASLSPTSSSTISLTPRPTWTLRPSATFTLTPTPTSTSTTTLAPTLTPATPAKINMWYALKSWDLTEQEHTIELVKSNTVLVGSNANYFGLAFSEGEGAIRFPGSLDANIWHWDRAYNLVRTGDAQGVIIYSELIQSAIDSGQVRLDDLPTWFNQYETRLTLLASSLPPLPGELGRELVEIVGEGSAFLWLVENPSGTQIYPLLNDIDYKQPHENAFVYDELTGDSSPDLVIYRQTTPGDTRLIPPHIFNLSVLPPLELPLQDQLPVDFGFEPRTQVSTHASEQGGKYLEFLFVLSPACPANVSQEYSWDGTKFNTTPLVYELVPIMDTAAFCEAVLDEAASSWGPGPAITVANAMREVWPPATDTQGHPYPADAFDQLRYRSGVEYALAGQPEAATQVLSEIIDTPIKPDSAWITPAKDFLQNYQTPDDLFIACQQAQFCNLHDALTTIVIASGANDFSQTLVYLQSHGVTIRSSGNMDFNQDGQMERWLIIQPRPGEKLEFWILYRAKTQVKAVFVKIFEAGNRNPFFHEPAGTVPVFQFELHKGYVFNYLPDFDLAYIQPVDVDYARPTLIRDGLQQAVNDLMAGKEPKAILATLLSLFNSPRFAGDCIAYRICDQFHYTMALVYDLTGDSANAIDQYLWVWRNYGSSPYAIMARLKLNYFPLPTYTRTPIPSKTPTSTRTITPTRTPTGTPTATSTPTSTPTSTGTPTATPTSNPYPDRNATYTPSSTGTPAPLAR